MKFNSSESSESGFPTIGPPDVIILTFLLSLIEGSLLSLVVRSSWSAYIKAHRRAFSFLGFLRSLSFIRKVSGTFFMFNAKNKLLNPDKQPYFESKLELYTKRAKFE